MIFLKCSDAAFAPSYATEYSAGADLKAAEECVIPPQGRAKVRTGVQIDRVDWASVPPGLIPELQVRARSGLAIKHGVMLSNGVGTVDADYPDEICVLLSNFGHDPFIIQKGDRIAQISLTYVKQISGLAVGGARTGGFGSTGKS